MREQGGRENGKSGVSGEKESEEDRKKYVQGGKAKKGKACKFDICTVNIYV